MQDAGPYGRGFRGMSQAFRRGPGYRVRRLDVRFSACGRRRPDTEHREPILGTGYRAMLDPPIRTPKISVFPRAILALLQTGARNRTRPIQWRKRRDDEEPYRMAVTDTLP